MSRTGISSAVFDCTIFAQALINPRGPAGACLAAAQKGEFRLFISSHIVREIRELPSKLPARLGVTDERVQGLINDVAKYAEPMDNIPVVFSYGRDPDDAPYVDLAIASGAFLVVSRDKDLLELMSEASPEGRELRATCPSFRVLTPPELIAMLSRPHTPPPPPL